MSVVRDDLSTKLVHLTRGTFDEGAQRFCSIARDGKLIDGSGLADDGYTRICFSETPLSMLGQILATKHEGFIYRPFGITVDKTWLFQRGGRPVIYQPATARNSLPEALGYRHVTYDPTDNTVPDFSHEREWRIPVAELSLDSSAMTVIVPTRAWALQHRENRRAEVQTTMLVTRGLGGRPMTEDRWFFLVLEDLGLSFGDVPEPPKDFRFPP
jgi:hypothetical protein